MRMFALEIRGRVDIENLDEADRSQVSNCDQLVFERSTVTDALKLGLPNEVALTELVLSGGKLELCRIEDCLWIQTKYYLSRRLDSREQELFVKSTLAQWSDGIGAEFAAEIEEEFGIELDFLPLLEDYDPFNPLVSIEEIS